MIKGLGFGKLLKQFFIISLISCFILLGNSFVNAYTRQVGTYGYHPYAESFDIMLDVDGTPYTETLGESKKIFRLIDDWTIKVYWFWNNGLPYFVFDDPRIHNDNNPNQGYLSVYYTCDEIISIEDSMPGNCSELSVNDNTSSIFGEFLSTLTSSDYYYFDYNTDRMNNYGIFCISNASVGNSLCFKDTSNANVVSGSLGIDIDTFNFSTANTSYLENAPSGGGEGGEGLGSSFNVYTGSRLKGVFGIDKDYTNLDMVYGYEGIGLFSDLCYGGFDIDNIFDPSESFEDFVGYKAGEGATIFQLYSRYSGFNNMTQFLQTILTRYQNNQINQFKTEPKALLMVGSQLNVAGIKPSYVAEYCDLLMNSDHSEIYTGNTVDSLRVKNWLNNQSNRNILRSSSGQNIIMQTPNVGIFGSGENIDFDPSNFFSNIMDQINTKLSNPTKGGAVGLLPGYIVVVFLGIIFIRLISH